MINVSVSEATINQVPCCWKWKTSTVTREVRRELTEFVEHFPHFKLRFPSKTRSIDMLPLTAWFAVSRTNYVTSGPRIAFWLVGGKGRYFKIIRYYIENSNQILSS